MDFSLAAKLHVALAPSTTTAVTSCTKLPTEVVYMSNMLSSVITRQAQHLEALMLGALACGFSSPVSTSYINIQACLILQFLISF